MKNNSNNTIEVCKRKYRLEKAHIMLVMTKLVDDETGLPLKSVNLSQKDELIKQGYDYIGLGPAGLGYWGKWEL